MKIEQILKSTKDFFEKNKGFCIGTSAMIATSIIDCQVFDIEMEGHPVGTFLFSNFGHAGLYCGKAVAGSIAILYSRYYENNFVIYTAVGLNTIAIASFIYFS